MNSPTPDQVFADPDQQLIVGLTESTLVYTPTGKPGWQCRLDDICWTSSRLDSRGVAEVRLHAPDGRVAAVIPAFEQIQRFYVALLRRLTLRPFFDGVREWLPTRVELLERAFWLAQQTTQEDGPWEAVQFEENGAVAVVRDRLLLMPPHAARVDRLRWEELAGIQYRLQSPLVLRDATRFYRRDSYLELPLPGLREDVHALVMARMAAARETGEPAVFRLPGIHYRDSRLAMEYSWELEGAQESDLIHPDEQVLAVAFGRSRGSLRPAEPVSTEPAALLDSLAGLGRPGGQLQIKTELFLTDRRLLQLDRETQTGTIVNNVALPVRGMPRPRATPASLIIGDLELQTDTAQPLDMASEFVENYRAWLRAGIPDPFSPVVELNLPAIQS